MNNADTDKTFYALSVTIEDLRDDQHSPAFISALRSLEALADSGYVEAATFLAELLALPGPHHDAEAAYKWFYIGLSQSGYSVEFDDQNRTPPYYCGPVGDFRNESLVSDLVVILGFERIKELDSEAAQQLQSLTREP